MIRALQRQLFTLRYDYESILDRQRATALLYVAVLTLVNTVGAMIIVTILDTVRGNEIPPARYIITVLPIFAIGIYWLVQRGNLTVALWLLILSQVLGIGLALRSGLDNNIIILMALPLITAGSMLRRESFVYITLMILGVALAAAFAQSQITQPVNYIPAERVFGDLSLMIFFVALSLGLLFIFSGQTEIVARRSQEQINAYSKVTNLSAQLLTIDDEDTAIAAALAFLRLNLNIGFAQFYTTDPNGTLKRRVRSAMGISASSESNETLAIGDLNIISIAARTQETQNASGASIPQRRSHFQAPTSYGVAIPSLYNETIYGVLDIQLTHDGDFDAQELSLLTTVATLLAGVLHHIRQVNNLRRDIAQQEQAAAAVRQRGSHVTDESFTWERYFDSRAGRVFGFDGDNRGGSFTPAYDIPDGLRPALQEGEISVSEESDEHGHIIQTLTVPILLNDQLLGAMGFCLPPGRRFTERQQRTAQTIARRLAIALENKRLYEQAQAQAERERQANAMSNTLLSATNVEAVLNLAAEQFNALLGAVSTHIHIQPETVGDTQLDEESHEPRA